MLKRLLFRSSVLLVIMIGGGAYLAYIKGVDVAALTGRLFSFAGLGDFNLETLRVDSESIEDDTRVLQAGKQRVYKWQDKHGQWHYTQIRPPADALAVQSMDLDPNQNVIAGFEVKPVDDETTPEEPPIRRAEPEKQPDELISGNPYSPETIKQLFEDAKGLQEALGERYKAQEQLLKRE